MLINDQRVVAMTLLLQAGVSLVLAALFGALFGSVAAWSAALGGAAATVPNAFLAARVMMASGAKAIFRSVWVGEIGKLALTVAIFAWIFSSVEPISVPALLAAFVAAQGAILGAALLSGMNWARQQG